MFKKVLSVLLACLMLFCSFAFAASAKTSEEVDTHLQFREDGTFRIMQISDLQDFFFMRAPTKKLLKAALDTCDPDIIVLTGDNISSTSLTMGSAAMAISQFMLVIQRYNIPVVMTFGNHDDERTLATKEIQEKMYEMYPCYIGCAGEDFGDTNLCTYYLRLGTPALKPLNSKWKEADIIAAAKADPVWKKFVRVKETLDKDGVKDAGFSDADLAFHGLRVTQTERLTVEPKVNSL